MKCRRHLGRFLCFTIASSVLSVAVASEIPITCTNPPDPQPVPTEYWLTLQSPATHIAHVSIRFPQAGGPLKLNMPVWNALYQVRNFAVNVENVRAADSAGKPLQVSQAGTNEWQISPSGGCIVVGYDIHLDVPGPFGSEFNAMHAFLNWAMVLMYAPELRSKPLQVRFQLGRDWKIRDLHLCSSGADVNAAAGSQARTSASPVVCYADSYDELVDSPVEIGEFQEYSFQQGGATYHIVVHADPSDYDSVRLQDVVRRVAQAGIEWMQDRPYDEYTFLYHFPRGPAGGGMEHAYGSAIAVSAATGAVDMNAVADVSAHEFFHLWNVKRIRPQSLEPIDYQHEQITPALWFSEGVTNTAGNLIRVRAGFMDESQYLAAVAAEITELEHRPAHLWQSAEASSMEAWFEGNAFYRTPERSISYYSKGDILGVLLDLRIRQATNGAKSLRDLFQWMNEHYAKQHRYFLDSAGVQEAAEAVSGQSFAQFFTDYVAGVKPIPYNDYFSFVGLRLDNTSRTVADPGFTVTANLGEEPEVTSVDPASDAACEGLQTGDRIADVNGHPASSHLTRQLGRMNPGDVIKLRTVRAGSERKLKIRLGSRQEQAYVLHDLPEVTGQQRAHRAAWIHSDDEPGGAP